VVIDESMAEKYFKGKKREKVKMNPAVLTNKTNAQIVLHFRTREPGGGREKEEKKGNRPFAQIPDKETQWRDGRRCVPSEGKERKKQEPPFA